MKYIWTQIIISVDCTHSILIAVHLKIIYNDTASDSSTFGVAV